MRVTGEVMLVTGASAGIGAATARVLARAGAVTVVHGRDRARTATVAAELRATPVVADLLEPAGVDALVDQALAAHGRVDVLVANAGRGHSGPFTAMTEAEIDELLSLDLGAAIRLTHRVLPGMLERGRGHLCFVTSIAGRTGVAGEAVYAAAKAGLDAFA
jgi:NADP-dependent 3-hydroxy acid dehydrogenase YdfG